MKNFAALLYGRDDGHLDHLCPLCSLLNIPLFLTSEELFKQAKSQYENLTVFLKHPNSVATDILNQFDSLITTLPKALLDPIFMLEELTQNKKLNIYWLPHGNSDKKNMEGLINENQLLVYGQKMIDMIPPNLKSKAKVIGNFRYLYFEKHKYFYENLLLKYFPQIFDKPAILYAPSWENEDLDKWIESLTKHLPNNYNLIIKLHPNTYQQGIGQTLSELYKDFSQIHFIKEFFPIYPLLSKIDYLYTDISSIGYDFLKFNRPLFFTCQNDDPLHKCGKEISMNSPYESIALDDYQNKRTALYKETFGTPINTLKIM